MLQSTKYELVEIFTSRQGEGAQVGREAIFIRFAHCNLNCPFCDTDKSPHFSLDLKTLLSRIPTQPRSVIITGGEPTLQNIKPLVENLKKRNYFTILETNGTNDLSELRKFFNYITISPKINGSLNHNTIADEVRVPVDDSTTVRILNYYMSSIRAYRYYLSPIEKNGKFMILEAMSLLAQVNERMIKWQLSLQTHKLAGIK